MKKIYVLAIVSAAVCAVLMFWFLNGYTKKSSDGSIESKIASEKIVKVVVAKQEIPENTLITQDMLDILQIPESAANVDAFNSVNAVVGKFTNVKILRQEQILRAKIYDEKTGNNDSLALALGSDTNVDEDSRAITLEVDLEEGIGGFAQKGDRVDIIAASKESVDAKVLVEGAYIIRIGDQHYTAETGVYTSVTLACSLEDCQKIYRIQADKQDKTKWYYTLLLRPKK